MINDNGFRCDHCGKQVPVDEFIGTKNRNHCPFCLWSKHVDDKVAGDRLASCQSGMQPVGLTYKQAGNDKYGQPKQGELMLIHVCSRGDKQSINRIAADDDTNKIISLLDSDSLSTEERQKIEQSGIKILGQ